MCVCAVAGAANNSQLVKSIVFTRNTHFVLQFFEVSTKKVTEWPILKLFMCLFTCVFLLVVHMCVAAK